MNRDREKGKVEIEGEKESKERRGEEMRDGKREKRK